MELEVDPKKMNCIEVQGINGLALPYIKRFFSHAGEVLALTKNNDRLIVRFKYPSSAAKAYRYNGKILDKNPIKIRHLSDSTPLEQIPQKKTHKKDCNIHNLNEGISDKIKYGPLNLPYHWVKVEQILRNFSDNELRWLIYELFIEKIQQILILYLTGSNSRSKHHEQVLIQMILKHKSKENSISTTQNVSTEKLEYTSLLPYDLQYQPAFLTWSHKLERSLRNCLLSFKNQGQAMNLRDLYQLFYKNSLKLEEGLKLFSDKEEPSQTDGEKQKKITFTQLSKMRAEICIEDWMPKFLERSEYRDIDDEHPSKQIQIFSDSYFHDGPSSAIVFQIFIDTFDGAISNPYAVNVFYEFKDYFAPNCLLIRHIDSRKNSYERLFFNLRIVNCMSERFQQKQYMQIWTIKTDLDRLYHRSEEYVGESTLQVNQRLIRISSVKMQRHNLVVGYWGNIQEIIYNIEVYLDYYCGYHEIETESEYSRSLAVFVICTNTSQEETKKMDALISEWKAKEKIRKSNTVLYLILIDNQNKFEEEKAKHYIEDQVNNIFRSPFSYDIAKLRARQFLHETPEKFQCIENAQRFITNTIWELYQKKIKQNTKKIVNCYKIVG